MTEPTPPVPPSIDAMERLQRDCDVEQFVAGGPGGQHRNKSATGVRLRHRPTGVVVTATERRSFRQNLSVALERLKKRLEARKRRRRPRIATRVPPREKRKRLEGKKRLSERKATRRRVDPD